MTVVPIRLLPAQLAALDGWPADRRTPRDWAADAGLFAIAVVIAIEQARVYPPPGVDFLHDWQIAANPWAGGAACLALWWRRRFPTVVAVLMVPALLLSASALGAALVAGLTVAVHRPWPRAAAVTGAYLLGVGYYAAFGGPPGVARTVVVGTLLLTFGAPFCLGLVVRARRLLVIGLRREAEVAEREHLLRLGDAHRAERERLAREMHDVLAHRVSLLSVHAGALAYRTAQAAAGTGPPLDAAEVGGAVAVIQDNARLALDELRDVLSVLRDDPPADAAPQPGLGDLARLVSEAEGAGQRVLFEGADVVERASRVRARVQRTAYRTVQEGLTNARKHAPGAPVTVRLSGSPGTDLTVTIENPAPGPAEGTRARATPMEGASRRPGPAHTQTIAGPADVPGGAGGSGRGLIGLAERAALDGGRLEYGPRDDTFRLSARLPWQV
ncbi:histidine kinase [Nonomuraea sp. NPDC046802]|uniref:sensor histidine kinase n=1 Tax=Nonomuraea sp. NPDC046802 TaxID=3154919 RepID=UPI0033E27DC0